MAQTVEEANLRNPTARKTTISDGIKAVRTEPKERKKVERKAADKVKDDAAKQGKDVDPEELEKAVAEAFKNAESRAAVRVYWRHLDANAHLGYRRAKSGRGSWVVRWSCVDDEDKHVEYKQKTIGAADDAGSGKGAYSFAAAEKLARQIVEAARGEEKAKANGPVQTVRSAIEDYIEDRDARERRHRRLPPKDADNEKDKFKSNARLRLNKHVLKRFFRNGKWVENPDPIADIPLHKLTKEQLQGWVTRLDSTLVTSTRKRLANDLKAALRATARKWSGFPKELHEIIRDGLDLSEEELIDENEDGGSRNEDALSVEEVGRVIEAARTVDERDGWDGDLYRMVFVLAATGTRFSQATRICVRDVLPDEKKIRIPGSRKGRKRKKKSPQRFPVAQDVLDALKPVVENRKADDILLERWHYSRKKGEIGWHRNARGPWKTSDMTKPFRAIVAEAGLSGEVVAYTLRHSSILRHLRTTPALLVANLHDTSLDMLQSTYGSAADDKLGDIAARGVVSLIPIDRTVT